MRVSSSFSASVSAAKSGTSRLAMSMTSTGHFAAAGTKAVKCSPSATILLPDRFSAARTSSKSERPVSARCFLLRSAIAAARAGRYG